jgi:transcriptional antiterminator RfaH
MLDAQNSEQADLLELPAADSARQWFAVHIRPHCERKAVLNLERQRVETFLPTQIKTVRHARQYRTVCRALFPGYLFVALDLGRDRWRSINGTYGVVGIVTHGGVPAHLPSGFVESLLAASSENGVMRFDHELKPGAKVRLLTGPFADFVGTLEHLDPQGRVKVLLDMMGGKVPVMSRARELMPA